MAVSDLLLHMRARDQYASSSSSMKCLQRPYYLKVGVLSAPSPRKVCNILNHFREEKNIYLYTHASFLIKVEMVPSLIICQVNHWQESYLSCKK